MIFASPILPRFANHPPEKATVQLSQLSDSLEVLVPDSDEFQANWSVYPILGADPEAPDWVGDEEPAGVWDDATDDVAKLKGIELRIPKAVLEKYSGTEVEVRYKFADESSLEPYSEPLKLDIKD